MGRFEEIEARANAATPGPWINLCGDIYSSAPTGEQCRCGCGPLVHGYVIDGDGQVRSSEVDLAFLVHAREDVPWLLARVRELERDLDERQDGTEAALLEQG